MGHEVRFAVLDSRDVRNTFFNFGSVLVRFFEKKIDLVWNEFGSVQKNLVRFGYYSYLHTHVIANITATVDDVTS